LGKEKISLVTHQSDEVILLTIFGFEPGAVLVARSEFSIVIAGLGVSAGLDVQLGALSAAYVLFLAILGPILARVIESLLLNRWRNR
jgi:Kef-type K+ transport system membrane component KefB